MYIILSELGAQCGKNWWTQPDPSAILVVQRLKWWYSLTHIYAYMYGNRVNQTMPADLFTKVSQWGSDPPSPFPPPPLNPSQILSSAPQLLPAFRVPLGGTAATNLTCALSFCLGPWGTLQQWNRTVDLIILKALSSPLGLGYPKDIILIIINWPRCLISVYVHHF